MQQLADRPRATRYAMSAPLMYRCVGDPVDWASGRVVDVSRSGVLFEAVPPFPPAATKIEFILELPSLGLPGRSQVKCQGRIVRHAAMRSDGSCAMAATIDVYEFLGILPERVRGSAVV